MVEKKKQQKWVNTEKAKKRAEIEEDGGKVIDDKVFRLE